MVERPAAPGGRAVGSRIGTNWIRPPQSLQATRDCRYLQSARSSSRQCGHSAKNPTTCVLGWSGSSRKRPWQSLHSTWAPAYLPATRSSCRQWGHSSRKPPGSTCGVLPAGDMVSLLSGRAGPGRRAVTRRGIGLRGTSADGMCGSRLVGRRPTVSSGRDPRVGLVRAAENGGWPPRSPPRPVH